MLGSLARTELRWLLLVQVPCWKKQMNKVTMYSAQCTMTRSIKSTSYLASESTWPFCVSQHIFWDPYLFSKSCLSCKQPLYFQILFCVTSFSVMAIFLQVFKISLISTFSYIYQLTISHAIQCNKYSHHSWHKQFMAAALYLTKLAFWSSVSFWYPPLTSGWS